MPIQPTSYAVPRADLGEAFYEFDGSAEGFVAADVLPVIPVPRKAATLSVIQRENLKRALDSHANGAAFARINLASEDLAYACVDHGLEEQLTDEDRKNYALDFDAEQATVNNIIHHQMIEREIRTKDIVWSTTTFAGAALFKDNSGSPWSTAATSIIGQIAVGKETARANSGNQPDSLLIGAAGLANLLANTELITRFPGAAVITEQMLRANLAAVFGLKNLFVGGRVYDSADEGVAFSGSDIWSDTYALLFKQATGDMKSYGLGRTVVWDMMAAGEVNVVQYREEQTKSDIFRGELFEVPKLFDAYAGHLMQIET